MAWLQLLWTARDVSVAVPPFPWFEQVACELLRYRRIQQHWGLPPPPASTNIVIKTCILEKKKVIQDFYLSLDWISFAVNNRVWRNNTIRTWIGLNDFEFHCAHSTANGKVVVFVNWTISFQKVWFQVDLEQISTNNNKNLNCIFFFNNSWVSALWRIVTWNDPTAIFFFLQSQ